MRLRFQILKTLGLLACFNDDFSRNFCKDKTTGGEYVSSTHLSTVQLALENETHPSDIPYFRLHILIESPPLKKQNNHVKSSHRVA